VNPDACFFCGTAISDGVLCAGCAETPEQSSRDHLAAVRRLAITEAVDRLTDDAAIALGDAVESAKYYEVRSGHNRAREKSAACIRAALRRALTEGT
jgi:hypothetical protein